MLTDCYEKGHTPDRYDAPGVMCAKCGQSIILARVRRRIGTHRVWHTQAELDRLWQGVDREAARVLTKEETDA